MRRQKMDRRACVAGIAALTGLGGGGTAATEGGGALSSFSNRAHFFAHPRHKDRLTWCFTSLLGADGPVSLPVPGLKEPILAFSFSGGGSVSVELTDDALDEKQARFGAWLEVRTPDPRLLQDKILEAGLQQVHYPATKTFYFAAPGGQVIGIVATEPR